MRDGIFPLLTLFMLGHLAVGAFAKIVCLISGIEFTYGNALVIWVVLMLCVILANLMSDLIKGNDGRT